MTPTKLKLFQDIKQGEEFPDIEDLQQLCDMADENLRSMAKALPGLERLAKSQETKKDPSKPDLAKIYQDKEAAVSESFEKLQTLKSSLAAAHEESKYRNR